jgi:UDP-N-acetylmuramoylalanine--D-glutamate ligase
MKLPDRNWYSFSADHAVVNGCYVETGTICINDQGSSETDMIYQDSISLKGKHNLKNILAAILATRKSGIGLSEIVKSIPSFIGLPHRLEYIGTFGGIYYYNDSIATIPEATIEAVMALKDVDTLILGGFDRGLDYSSLVDFLKSSKIGNLVFIGPAGERIRKDIESRDQIINKNLYSFKGLEDAAQVIKSATKKGKICLLSPAAASYDQYADYRERGEVFKKIAGS